MATKTVEERNAEFWALPPNKQRVEVAKDVLAQLDAGKYLAQAGDYVYLRGGDRLVVGRRHDTSLQELLPKLNPCEVCARGAVFLSVVNKGNRCKVEEAFTRSGGLMGSIRDKVSTQVFALDTLFDMERYFESRTYYDNYSDESKLRRITESVIKNDGEFNLDDVTS